MSICDKQTAVKDYAMGEAPAPGIERHLETCAACAEEFDQLRLTTAALRILPDRDIPQRIAFVSDKVFKPSFLAGFWKPAMISASVLAAGLIIAHRPDATVAQVYRPARNPEAKSLQPQIDEAVAKAVANIRNEDDRRLRTIETEYRADRQKEHQAVMEAINVFQERQNAATLLAVADTARQGAGQ